MVKSLLYKEWIKTKQVIIIIAIVFAAFALYNYINITQEFRISGAVATWTDVILKDTLVVPQILQLTLFLCGIGLAVAQFVPEMANKRLKLTMHLPMSETRIIVTMVGYGVCMLTLLFIIIGAVLGLETSIFYPSEIVNSLYLRTLPWYLGGIISYIFTVWICLEPTWKQKIANALIAVFALSLLVRSSASGVYEKFFITIIIFTVIAFVFPLYSAARFKDGEQ